MAYFKADELCFSSTKHHHKVFSTTPVTQHQFCITDWEPRLQRAYLCFFPETFPWTMSTRVIFPCLRACTAVHSTIGQCRRCVSMGRVSLKVTGSTSVCVLLPQPSRVAACWEQTLQQELSSSTHTHENEAEWNEELTTLLRTSANTMCDPHPHAQTQELLTLFQKALSGVYNFQHCRNTAQHILPALLSMKIPTLWWDTTSLCAPTAHQ